MKKKNKIINNLKIFIKENYKQLIFLTIFIIAVNLELPYYIEAPGGTINLTERIHSDYNKQEGSLNMLYVTQYRGNVATILLGKILPSWDIYEISKQQISNETASEIHNRNKVMLDNSIQNATFVAYAHTDKKITITGIKNIVIATTKDNGIEIGDIILSADNQKISTINDLKLIIEDKNVGDNINILVERNNKEQNIELIYIIFLLFRNCMFFCGFGIIKIFKKISKKVLTF